MLKMYNTCIRIIPGYKVKFHKLHVLMLLVCISTESSLFTYDSHLQRFQPVQRNVISTSMCWRNRICKRLSLTFVVIRANLSDNSRLNNFRIDLLKKHNPPLKIILFKQREIDLKIVDRCSILQDFLYDSTFCIYF